MTRVIFNTVLTLAVCILFLFFTTNGFSVFTSEGARRQNIQQNPISLPTIPLVSSTGEEFSIQEFQGKIVLVEFIFTSCTGICPMMTQNFIKLQKELLNSSRKELVVLLTVSFDLKRDTQQVLFNYAEAVGADFFNWKFATVANENDLKTLLDTFGIVVIPAPNDQFEHNSAIHLVNQEGKLSAIYDYESIELIVNDINKILYES